MNNKAITILCLAAVVLLSVAGTKVSKLTRTQTFASNDLFIVVTGSTVKVTRHVRAKDLAEGLGPWITNSGSGGSATNAVSTTRTNGTVISTVSTSLDFIEGTNVTLRATNAAGVVTVQINASGGGVGPTNGNQFGASLTLSIKDDALLTNISVRTALTLPTLTASRAAVLNSTGQLTNSAAVSDVEMEYLDGVTSAIQTQLDTKTALTTNANQFGASTTLTIKDGAKLTNAINEGITIFNGDSSNRANLIVKGAVNPKIRLTSISPPQVLQLSSTEISTDVGGGQPYITISPEAYPTLRINTNSLEAINSGYNLGTVTVPLGSIYAQNFIGSGTATPYLLLSSPNGASFALSVNTNRTIQTSNTLDFSTLAANDVIKMHSGSAGINVLTNGPASRVTPVVVAGVGTPSTNFTWLSTQQEISLTTTANVFIASVTGFDAAVVDYWTCVITNGSGTNRTLGFSAGTNNWRFNGVYGTNAPSVITNNTRIEISGRQHGTNTQVVYGYTPWP